VREANGSPASNVEARNERSCTAAPPMCFHGVHRYSFTFYLLISKNRMNKNSFFDSFTLKKKALRSFEASTKIYQSTKHNVPQENLQKHHCENLKSRRMNEINEFGSTWILTVYLMTLPITQTIRSIDRKTESDINNQRN
jgi:hypothetical protein